MNREEAVKKLVTIWGYSKDNAEYLYDTIVPRPVVPQYVADWYEKHKYEFYLNLHRVVRDFFEKLNANAIYNENPIDYDFACWYYNTKNAIQILVNMHQFGYEVEKEKLYTVEIPNPNGDSNRYGLCKVDGRIIIGSFVFGLNKATNTKLTEAEIKEDFDWAWKWAKEVKE